MKWSLALFLAPVLHLAVALSSSGSRLLVVNEDSAEQKKYSKFFGDLKGKLSRFVALASGADHLAIEQIEDMSFLSNRQRTRSLLFLSMDYENMTTSYYSLRNQKVELPKPRTRCIKLRLD